jgi:hypothetical protein
MNEERRRRKRRSRDTRQAHRAGAASVAAVALTDDGSGASDECTASFTGSWNAVCCNDDLNLVVPSPVGQTASFSLKAADPSKIYQIILDNTVNAEEVVDMRVPVYGSHIPLVYQKYKRMNVRYTNEVHRTTLHRPDELLSANEQDQIIAFTKMMGADWCELDVLRHRADGKIYIVDLNKTAFGPPAELLQKDEAVTLLTASFRNAFV